MRDLYDRLIDEGEAGILRLIEGRAQEGLQLDFKQKRDPTRGLFDEKDKQILAKAVSGFANSAGGLIVWGVNAKPGPDGVDCAQAPPAPISDIERFMSEATRLVGQLIQPRHDGIYISSVKSSSEDGSGFLLMYVQRSERRPHRSEAKDQKQYFKRAGDSFFEMEHYDIEDAFSRTDKPDLDLYYEITQQATYYKNLGYARSLITFGLINKSTVMARFPYIQIKSSPGINSAPVMDFGHLPGLEPSISHSHFIFSGGANDVVHVGQRLAIAKLTIQSTFVDRDWMLGGQRLNEAVVDFRCSFGCEGCGERTEHISLEAYEAGHRS